MKTIILYIISFILSILLNLLLWRLWNRKKIKIIQSKVDSSRWGSTSVPMVGGISICVVVICNFLYFLFNYSVYNNFIVIIIGGIAMFILGLVDDIFELKSFQKFIGQAVIILIVITLGIKLEILGNMFDIPLTFLWILGITNAINLLDNMDGLAGGITIIAAVFLGINFGIAGYEVFSIFSFIIAITVFGFLIFNFKPAKIYLGDNGSLLLGFFLASLTIVGTNSSGRSLFGVLIFPVIVLSIPIWDTIFVSITRKLRGQSPFDGGKDHLSHRLVLLGMSERQAVIFLYIISILMGLTIYILNNVNIFTAFAVYFFISIIVVLFGVFIGKIKISQSEPINKERTVTLKTNFLYKYNILKIFIDIIILGFIYYLSYLIQYRGEINNKNLELIMQSFALVIILKVFLLYFFGVYKIDYKYFTLTDFLKIVKSITTASVIVILILTFWIRFNGYSRSLFIIDWTLSIIILTIIKYSSCLFNELFYSLKKNNILKAVFLGERENYRVVDSALKIKEKRKIKLYDFILGKNYKPGSLKLKDNINIIIVESRYKKVFNKKDEEIIRKKNIKLYDLKEFINILLEGKEE